MRRVEQVVFVAVAIVVAGAVAVTTFDTGLIQGRYDVGAPGWVEGSFGWLYLLVGATVTLVALGVAAVIARGAAGGLRHWLRDLLVGAVVALWAGYAAGWSTAALAGPTVQRPGTVRFTLGPPISTSFEAAATCVSIIGDGEVLAELDPLDADVPVVYFRHRVWRNPYPTIVQLDEERSFVIAGGDPQSIGPYDWTVHALEEGSDSGRMVTTGARWGGGTGPLSIDVEVTWACQPKPR